MYEISRTVRFCLTADGSLADDAPRANTYAAWPPMRGLGRYYELDVVCAGQVDPVTGFFVFTQHIDRAVREQALPLLSQAARAGEPVDLLAMLRRMMEAVARDLDARVRRLTLRLTPTYALSIEDDDMTQILISQQYDIAAAHRLHAAGLSDEQNVERFGKCNNPAGHGHNYRLEVTVRGGSDAPAVEKLDELVDRLVIQKLDHKNLNSDVPQFANLTTTVENIAKVIFDMLDTGLSDTGLTLEQVRVWETDKTFCTYRRD